VWTESEYFFDGMKKLFLFLRTRGKYVFYGHHK